MVHFQQDSAGRDLDLRYFRDTDGREVDFVVTERGQPRWLVECKLRDAMSIAGFVTSTPAFLRPRLADFGW